MMVLLFQEYLIIDKEDIIQYYTFNNLLCGKSIDKLLRILELIQENPDQTCSVN